jgi:hypothetical protein
MHDAPGPQLDALHFAAHVPSWQRVPPVQSPSAPHAPFGTQPPPVLHFSPLKQLIVLPHIGAHWPICRHTPLPPQSVDD